MKILLVEDEPISAKVLTNALNQGNHEVLLATSGLEAYRLLSTSDDIDLVISDIIMPGVDGLQLIQRIKDEPRLNHIPVVLTTASTDSKTVLQGLHLGATDFIAKPFDVVALGDKLKKIEQGLRSGVLVVENEKIVRNLLLQILHREGYYAVGVESGPEALDMLKSNKRICLVLTDIFMEPMSGEDLLMEIKKVNESMPVVLMTGNTSQFTAEKAAALGAAGYLTKPFNRDEIIRVIMPCLRTRPAAQSSL
ncbi:MAG TPA: response regulator [candidate division Zixibacteria bacterium]|nr:response regulator [candidate division Zixibacteria bacterium]